MTKFNVKLGDKVPNGIAIDTDLMVNESDRESFATLWNASPALRYIVEYGWKQSLNDTIAGVKTTDKDYSVANTLALVEKRRDAILTGSVKKAVGRGPAVDAITREARRLAELAFAGLGKAKQTATIAKFADWLKSNGADSDDKSARRAAILAIAAKPDIIASATVNVASTPTVDLDDIGPPSDDESDDNEE